MTTVATRPSLLTRLRKAWRRLWLRAHIGWAQEEISQMVWQGEGTDHPRIVFLRQFIERQRRHIAALDLN